MPDAPDSISGAPLVELRGVALTRAGRAVLRDVQLVVRPGERVAVLGANGCGKSTLLQAIAGLLPAGDLRGSVTLAGVEGGRLRGSRRARLVSMVAQESPRAGGWEVGDLVELGRVPWRTLVGHDRPDASQVLALAHADARVDHLVGRRMDQLSGGERRRVMLARGYAQAARVLLLDEPLAHLDLGQASAVLAGATRQAARREGCVIAALHEPSQALVWATRVVLLAEERVLADGPPREVVTATNLARVYGTPVELLRRPDGTPVAVLAAAR